MNVAPFHHEVFLLVEVLAAHVGLASPVDAVARLLLSLPGHLLSPGSFILGCLPKVRKLLQIKSLIESTD